MNSFIRRRHVGAKTTKPETKEIAISKAALELANSSNFDYSQVKGTGKDGLITVLDIRQAIKNTTDEEE